MAALISTSDFVGEYFIPNLDQTDLADHLTEAINKHEPKVLQSLLGYTLYKDYVANPGDTRWTELISGKEFSFSLNSKTVEAKWEGLKNVILPYVYFKYQVAELTTPSGLGGQVVVSEENSETVSSVPKLSRAWNEMVEIYGTLEINDVGYDVYYFDKYTLSEYEHVNDLPSAYNFLLANKATYDGWVFSPLKFTNSAGI